MTSSRYVYQLDPASGYPFRHVLAEIRHEIECPACGVRSQVQQVD